MKKFCINCKKEVFIYDNHCNECGSSDLLEIIDDEIVINSNTAPKILDKKLLNFYKISKNGVPMKGPNKDICRYNIITKKIINNNI